MQGLRGPHCVSCFVAVGLGRCRAGGVLHTGTTAGHHRLRRRTVLHRCRPGPARAREPPPHTGLRCCLRDRLHVCRGADPCFGEGGQLLRVLGQGQPVHHNEVHQGHAQDLRREQGKSLRPHHPPYAYQSRAEDVDPCDNNQQSIQWAAACTETCGTSACRRTVKLADSSALQKERLGPTE